MSQNIRLNLQNNFLETKNSFFPLYFLLLVEYYQLPNMRRQNKKIVKKIKNNF